MGDLPPRSLDDEIAFRVERVEERLRRDYEARHAASVKAIEEQYARARSRFQWWTGGLGAAALAIAVGWAGTAINTEVQAETTAMATQLSGDFDRSIDSYRRELDTYINSRIETQFNRERALIEGRLERERAITTLLPLVVGEAIDFDDEGLNNPASVSLVVDALEVIGPEVAELDGFVFDLAARRLERVLDTFWTRGALHDLHRAFNVLPADLRERLLAHDHEGILYTMADGLTEEILLVGQLPQNRAATYQLVLQQSPNPEGFAYEAVALLRIVEQVSRTGWNVADLSAALSVENGRWPMFTDFVMDAQLCPLVRRHRAGSAPPGSLFSVHLDAFAQAMAQSPLTLEERCAAT